MLGTAVQTFGFHRHIPGRSGIGGLRFASLLVGPDTHIFGDRNPSCKVPFGERLHFAMERSTIFNGKIHYFDWAIFNGYVSSPEGTLQ